MREPIFTCTMSQAEITSIKITPYQPPALPIHTQSTERMVKEVTTAAASVAGQSARDGFVRARLHNRAELPALQSEKDIVQKF